MRSREVSSVKDVLGDVVRKLEKKKGIPKEEIENLWKDLVGEMGFKHSRPVSLKGKVLMIGVDNSSWMQGLTMKKRRLLKGLRKVLGREKILDVRFRMGEFNA
ncbi:MAG: DUF721 domain-containing protein [Candidatus Omnitrophica bacterium]|nr:DUF721 domain-containing protein [Candidatus Omnitrophota bacterium]